MLMFSALLLLHGVLFHGFHQALNAGLILGSIEVAGIGLVAVEAGAGDAQVGGEAALHLGHVAGPGLAGTVVVHQHAVNLVVAADAFTPIDALLDTDGVGSLVVGTGHSVQILVHEAEGGSVHHGGDVDAVGLQGLEQVGQLGPAGDALEHDAVLLGEGSGGGAFLDGDLQILLQQLKGLGGLHLAAGSHDVGHVVEQVETGVTGITVTKVIAKWFTGHEMALAMGLQVALARVGTACALFFALPIAQSFGEISAPVMIGASALCIGLLSYIIYCVMDKKLDASMEGDTIGEDSEEQFKFSDLKHIFCNKGFWLITLLCLIFYSAVFPFLKFATNLMIIKYNVSPELAGIIPGLLPFGTILLTPLFGSLYDKMGKGATLMIIGSILLTIVHILFALPLLNVWWFAVIIMILLGIAFSLVPSAMWPSVPKIIPLKQLGSAYAIIFYIQNIGLSMVPVLIGNVIKNNTANGTTDYTMPMSIFALFGAIAVVISILLKVVDKRYGYGLEKKNME